MNDRVRQQIIEILEAAPNDVPTPRREDDLSPAVAFLIWTPVGFGLWMIGLWLLFDQLLTRLHHLQQLVVFG